MENFVISGRVAATRCSELTGGMPPMPPALTEGLRCVIECVFLLHILDHLKSIYLKCVKYIEQANEYLRLLYF